MRILVVTQYFWPESFRINDLVEGLVNRGHEVTVLTGEPNYPSGTLFTDYKKDPDSFNFYKGCRVVRVPITMRGQGSGRKLLLNYISYAFSASILGLWRLRKERFDVIFVFQLSPVMIALPAILYKFFYKKPIIMWVQDLWPDSLEAVGVVRSPRVLNVIGKLVAFIYKRCDLILGQSKSFFKGISRYCSDAKKIHYFPNWSESFFFELGVEPINEIFSYKGLRVLFAGNIGEAQDFVSIIKAAEILKIRKLKIRIFVVGDGRHFEWVKQEIIKQQLQDYVCLMGRYPLEEMPRFYASADALLATLKESQVFSMTIPSKIQSYMAAGKPILTMLSGEGSRVVDEAKCGLTARSGDFTSLAENIMALSCYSQDQLSILGANAKAYAQSEFDRDTLISQLEQWFIDVSESTKRSN